MTTSYRVAIRLRQFHEHPVTGGVADSFETISSDSIRGAVSEALNRIYHDPERNNFAASCLLIEDGVARWSGGFRCGDFDVGAIIAIDVGRHGPEAATIPSLPPAYKPGIF